MKRSEHAKQRRSERCGREAAVGIQQSGKPAEIAARAVQRKPPVGAPQDDATYWESRADRTRRQAGRYQDQATREHFMKIAAGYEALAASARSVGQGPE